MNETARGSLLVALGLTVLALSAGCRRGPAAGPGPVSAPFIRQEVAAPGARAEEPAAPLAPGRFDEIVVADFEDKSPWPGLEAGRETAAYIARELVSWFPGPVSRVEGGKEPAGSGRAVVLTGSVTLSRQLRKALRPGLPVDGPFRTARSELLERSVYTLVLSVAAASGEEVLFERTFEPSRTYEDFEKEADLAFYELLDRVKSELFPALFGRASRRPL